MNSDNRGRTSGFVVKVTELKQQLRRRAVLGTMLVAALTMCVTLSACGGSASQPPQAGGQPPQAGGQGGPWADTITGTVVWPDGSPLANAQIDIFPQGEAGGGTMETTGPDGSYTSRACTQFTCSNLQAWFAAPISDSFQDGCYIQLSTNLGSNQGFTLNQGQVDWVIDSQNCDTVPGAADVSHPLTWQQAQGMVNGCVSLRGMTFPGVSVMR
jgi:hypothetical protein